MSQQVNLFNPAFVQRRQSFSLVMMLQGLGLILAGGAAMYGYADYQVGRLEHQVEESAQRFNAEQLRLGGLAAEFSPQRSSLELQEEVRRLERQAGEQAELLGVLESGALGNSAGYSGYMRAFSRQVVPGLWLTGFNVGGGGAQLSLSGGVMHPDLLPEYIQRLRREEVMQGKMFAALQMRQAAADKPGAAARYVEFELRSVVAEVRE